MWITDVFFKHGHFSESFVCFNTPLVVLLTNPSLKEEETSHVVMRQACQPDLGCADYHHSIPMQ